MLKEFLTLLLTAFPGWALLALDLWDRLRPRRKKNKRSDGKRKEVEKQ